MTSHFISKPASLARAALVAAAALTLAGCAGGAPEPGASPGTTQSVAASASVTPTPTPTMSPVYKPASAAGPAKNVPLPVLPAVAKAETKEGLEAFSRYWFSVLSYSYETGDVALFESLAPRDCETCQKVMKVIEDWHSEGRWLVGGKLSTPVASTTFKRGQTGTYQVAVQVRQEPLTYMRADGSVAHTEPQEPDQGNLLVLAYENGAWSVVELGSIVG